MKKTRSKREPSYGYGINENTGRGCGEKTADIPVRPLEIFHDRLMTAFHVLRGIKGENPNKTLTLDGIEFSQMVAKCKMDTYKITGQKP